MFCKNCGKDIAEGAKFCPSCGTPTQSPSAPAVPPMAVSTPPPAPPYVRPEVRPEPVPVYSPVPEMPVRKKKSKAPLVAGIAVVGIIGAGAGALFFLGKDKDKEKEDPALTQANQEAASLYKAVDGVMDDMSDEGIAVEDGYYLFSDSYEKPDEEPEQADVTVSDPDYFLWMLSEEYEELEELDGFGFWVDDGDLISVVLEQDDTFGAYPKPVTSETVEDMKLDEDALDAAAEAPDDDRKDADDESRKDDDSSDAEDSESEDDGGSDDGEEGDLTINRETLDECIPMGEDGTWTVFVYLCGSDLETYGGMASSDLEEMLEISGNENIRFVVQTGGAEAWELNVDADRLQRYEICDGEAILVDEQDNDNMGDGAVLTDFLSWGVENYPAAKMGLIFWNHGSGSINGVCFDEYTMDSLSLKEIDAALYSVQTQMTDQFEFIGFDACLMGTAETAAILTTHARYMIGSEDIIPGTGWDYEAIAEFLTDNPDADGLALGEAICESYYDSYEGTYMEDVITLSVIDLSKMDALMGAFHSYAEDLYTLTADEKELAYVLRGIENAENYGGNNISEGYTNMVDMGGIVTAGLDYSDYAQPVLDALEDAVVYMVNGDMHEESSGLAMYYPLQVQGSQELNILREICLSPYYMAFVDKITYGLTSAGDIADYENEEVMEDGADWGNEDYVYDENNDFYYYEEDYDDYWDYVDDYEITGASSAISFDIAPNMDADGYYNFTLSEEGLYNAASVQGSVYLISDDGLDIIDLGLTCDIIADWDTGYFCDNFDGYWFSLPDGQTLSVYIVEEGDGYDIYTCPIMLNGEETYLRICHEYVETGEVYILGTWSGVDENGAAARETEPLEEGDVIVPLYYAYEIDTWTECEYVGEEYVYEEGDSVYFDILPDGEYLYGFFIDDFYGDYYETDYVNFTVDGYDIYFDDLSDY